MPVLSNATLAERIQLVAFVNTSTSGVLWSTEFPPLTLVAWFVKEPFPRQYFDAHKNFLFFSVFPRYRRKHRSQHRPGRFSGHFLARIQTTELCHRWRIRRLWRMRRLLLYSILHQLDRYQLAWRKPRRNNLLLRAVRIHRQLRWPPWLCRWNWFLIWDTHAGTTSPDSCWSELCHHILPSQRFQWGGPWSPCFREYPLEWWNRRYHKSRILELRILFLQCRWRW